MNKTLKIEERKDKFEGINNNRETITISKSEAATERTDSRYSKKWEHHWSTTKTTKNGTIKPVKKHANKRVTTNWNVKSTKDYYSTKFKTARKKAHAIYMKEKWIEVKGRETKNITTERKSTKIEDRT